MLVMLAKSKIIGLSLASLPKNACKKVSSLGEGIIKLCDAFPLCKYTRQSWQKLDLPSSG
jgi:hypothetical protein